MSVHYKFKSALEYDTVTFDGLHISVKDLKNAILQQKRIGKSTDFDLQVTNAQTKEVYDDENALIPKNTSLLIARIPTIVQKTKQWEGYGGDSTPPAKVDEGGPIAKAVDLSSLDAPEDDKIKAMMSQSTQDYDPSNYMKIRGANQIGVVPPNYRCYKCHQGGHWIKDCTFGQGPDPVEIKKSTGIPKSFMVPVEGPQVQGAMMTPNGSYAVPVLDHQAYNQKSSAPTPVPEPKPEIPEDLLCNICSDLLTDAVMIPCCGNSFCDECIRSMLLESEDHECPDCHEKDISPVTLIPNRFLRKSVATFKNTTGYVKKPIYREKPEPKPVESTEIENKKESTPPPEPESTEKIKSDTEEKTVISEADSTEQAKNEQNVDFAKDIDVSKPAKSTETESIPEGPPGVSPRSSPKQQRIRRVNASREPREKSGRHHKTKNESPRRSSRHRRSPNYSDCGSVVFAHKSRNEIKSREDRPGTPTVDEPTGSNFKPSTNVSFNSSAAPPGTLPPMMGNMGPLQGPPHVVPTTYSNQPPMAPFPPAQGPPPNFRLPPPGAVPPPYMAPGPYSVPPRAMFDPSRPPMGGPPPPYQNFPPGSRGHRDYRGRMRERTPPGVIDDPLAAFNKMLREKDERERRAKQRNMRRSYSRSRSRSYSRSPVRRRSRSPRPTRRSRSRSRSFSLSRSRSRSYSGSFRGSPYRQLSPPRRSSPPPLSSRRGPTRYRSPIRSPPRGRHQNDRHRDRDYDDDRDRDYNREDRPFKDNRRVKEVRDRRSRERDRDRYFDNYEDRRGPSRQPQWQQPQSMPQRSIQDNYYPPPDMQQGFQTNRYPQVPPREFGPPFMNKEPPFNQPLPQTIHSIQPQRRYEDIAPPGVDDDIAPPGVEEPPFKFAPSEHKERHPSPRNDDKGKESSEHRRNLDRKERDRTPDRKRRHEKRSRTPDKARNPSPKIRPKSKEKDSPDKHRRRRRDSSDREEKDRKRDHSDDEKTRKGKDKKKHKDKKESEKRKKRDKKDKHKKEGKDKKSKEEFKQVIPKNTNVEFGEDKKVLEETKIKELEEERRLEEIRLEAIKEEKKLEAIKEEKRRKAEEEAKKIAALAEKEKIIELRLTPEPDESKIDLYGDVLPEEIDTVVIENYGKLEGKSFEEKKDSEIEVVEIDDEVIEEGEIKDFDDEEKDVLELHSTDLDLKAEVDKSDILAPVPEKSKWEVEEDGQIITSPQDSFKSDSKSDKSGKVTNEVLKRAENAIFAKAINAIRPIEIKKISIDRAKLYSGEREVEKSHNQLQVTVASAAVDIKRIDAPQPPVRLSVKERLGVKVEDTDKVINLDRRSRTISPFSRRGESGRNYALGERRIEANDFRGHRDRNRRSRSRRRESSREHFRNRSDNRHRRQEPKRNDRRREYSSRKDEKRKHEDDKKSKRKRSKSRSESEDRKDKHKKKDKKQKKEKTKKTKDDEAKDGKDEKSEVKLQTVTTKRKPTIDEANFEPDYDLESHTDDEEGDKKKDSKKHSEKEDDDKKSSSSASDSDSSSEEERKKKKHKKHRKKKKKETSSSSSSDSESESSDSDRDRKKRKHKKNKKKKKKSKHK